MDELIEQLQDELAAWVRARREPSGVKPGLTPAADRFTNALLHLAMPPGLLGLLETVGRQRVWVQDGAGRLDDEAALAAALLEMLNRPDHRL